MRERFGKYELTQTRSGAWYWRVIGANGELLAHSESYASKQMAKKGLQAARKAALGPVVEVAHPNATGESVTG